MNTQNIGDLIKQLAANIEEVYSLPCKVVSIDSDNLAELEPLNGDPNLLAVRLVAGASDNPLLITPVIGSAVIATFLSRNTAFISLFSEIESVEIRGGDLGGLIKIEELKSELAKLTARVDDIISAINGGVPVATDGGAALQTSIKTALALIIDKENFTNMENEKVKHG